ncbi:MAG: hypothetical protein U1F15_13855 [Burkholderiales bacterium]
MPSPLFVALALAMTAIALAFVLRPLRARRGTAALVVAVALVALGAYALLGEPDVLADDGELDAQAALASLPASAVRDKLAAHVARNPRDARGLIMLARLEFAQDRYAEAADAYRRALAASTKADADPAIWCEYADALGMAQGGSLAGEPRTLVLRALERRPTHPRALEMAGSAAFEAGEYPLAALHWRTLVAQLPDDAPERRDLDLAAARAELLADRGR